MKNRIEIENEIRNCGFNPIKYTKLHYIWMYMDALKYSIKRYLH